MTSGQIKYCACLLPIAFAASISLPAVGQAPSGVVPSTATPSTATPSTATPTTPSTTTPATAAPESEWSQVQQSIQAQLGKAQECNATNDCAVVALGHEPCGGPARFEAYSKKSLDSSALQALAARQRELALQRDRALSRVGICRVLPIPEPQCVQQRCTLNSEAAIM